MNVETNFWDFLKWLSVAVSVTAGIFFAVRGIITLIDLYKDSLYDRTFRHLQDMVQHLPVNSDNFDKIDIEFMKMEEMDDAGLALRESFLRRFAKEYQKRSKTEAKTVSNDRIKQENLLKSIENDLKQVERDLVKCKDYDERQKLSAQEHDLMVGFRYISMLNPVVEKIEIKVPKKREKKVVEPTLELQS